MTIDPAQMKDLLAAMAGEQLTLIEGKDLVADGGWHRCNAANKPRDNTSGSYLLRTGGPAPCALFRNWTNGSDKPTFWRGKTTRPLTEAEQQELDRWLAEARKQAEELAAEAREKAKWRAQNEWEAATPARLTIRTLNVRTSSRIACG